MENKKKTLYIDMDNVLVDFVSGLNKVDIITKEKYKGHEDDIPGIFGMMDPMPGAIEAFHFLAKHFDTYILSTAPWENPSAWMDKRNWVANYFPEVAYKRLIISHNKNLNKGDYLIDDRLKNGADKFEGKHIHFGQSDLLDWKTVVLELCDKEGIEIPEGILRK